MLADLDHIFPKTAETTQLLQAQQHLLGRNIRRDGSQNRQTTISQCKLSTVTGWCSQCPHRVSRVLSPRA